MTINIVLISKNIIYKIKNKLSTCDILTKY